MSSDSAEACNAASLENFKERLRQEWRIKRGTDYSYTLKYGDLRVLCDLAFQETIQEVAAEAGLTVMEWFPYNTARRP